jgi:hypothetical protein
VRGYAGRVGQRGEQATGDAQGGFLPATADNLASDYLFEPAGAEAAGAAEIAAVAVDDHVQPGDPGPGPERLPGGV